jgi:hypothetical protein
MAYATGGGSLLAGGSNPFSGGGGGVSPSLGPNYSQTGGPTGTYDYTGQFGR